MVAMLACAGRREQAIREHAEQELRNLRSALKLYRERIGRYPTASDGLQALVTPGILTSLPKDPWGYDYLYTNEKGVLILKSFGRDGVRGGTGPDEDIALEIGPAL